MTTLNLSHDGLERLLRGWNYLNGLRRGSEIPFIRAAAARVIERIHARATLARALQMWRESREAAAYEELLRADPRLMAELRAAADRSEWSQG